MRVNLLLTGRIIGLAFGALALGGVVVASCTFSPGPAGSGATGSSTGPATSTGTQTGQSTGNPFGGSSGTGTAGVGGTINPDGPNCGGAKYDAQNVPPDLLIILDKSGSMNQQADGMNCPGMGAACPTQKWPAMVAGINQVVMATQDKVNWGLKYFPTNGGCGVNAGAEVGIAPNNAAMVMTSLGMNAPNGNTPTRAAVSAGATYLMGLADANPKYILLATDGLPNCPANGGGNGTADDGPATAAIMAANQAGIPVFVVGIGTIPGATATLNGFADAGGRPRVGDPRYYQVDNTADLVSVLTMLTGQIASCTFSLGSVPPVPNNIAVYGDGTKIPMSATDGWTYGTGMRSITLNGPTCDKVKAKQIVNVTTYFGCPGEIIP